MRRPTSPLAIPALLASNAALAVGPWMVRLSGSQAGIGPISAAFWRLALALPFLLLAAWRIERPRLALRPTTIVAFGGIAFGIDLALWHAGILHTRLANATLLGNLAALAFPLYGFWMARTWPHLRQWLALLLAAIGTAALVGRSYHLSADHLTGDLLCIAAGACYLAYLIAADRALGRVPQISMLAIAGLAGLPLLGGAVWAVGDPFWPRNWTAPILLSLGSQIIGQSLLLYGVSRVQPIVVGLMLLTQPVIAAAIGWILYGERLSALDAAGAIAIGIAVVLVRDARKPAALRPAQAGLGSPS